MKNEQNPVRAMMRPLPEKLLSLDELNFRREEHILEWLKTAPTSVSCVMIQCNCENIPGSFESSYRQLRMISNILKRLERKGKVISTLYGQYRYYSIPILDKDRR